MTLAQIWLIAGILLMLSELFIPGFVIIFFGVAAVVMAGVTWLMPCLCLTWQTILYIVFSLILLVACRRYLTGIFSGKTEATREDPDDDGTIGAVATVVEAIVPGTPGRVSFRETNWTAISDFELPVGSSVVILERKNITLKVKPNK